MLVFLDAGRAVVGYWGVAAGHVAVGRGDRLGRGGGGLLLPAMAAWYVGGGSDGVRPTWLRFRAAMRAWIEVCSGWLAMVRLVRRTGRWETTM